MKIIISPAKKMNADPDTFPCQALPHFLPEAEQLLHTLQALEYTHIKALWGCNDAIAKLNFERLSRMELTRRLTPALLSYEGIQYQYMAPGVFARDQLAYIGEHLRILSGFYGLLRPFDGVTPYRLEMGAKLCVGIAKNLYAFWGEKIALALASETGLILNLASKEYSKIITDHLPAHVRFLTCTFGERKDGKVVEKGTLCKMARGEMVRYLAEHSYTSPEEITGFDRLGYTYAPELSTENNLVFLT